MRRKMVYLTFLLAAFASLIACQPGMKEIYEIPDGYRGWVEIRFSRPGCPPLPRSAEGIVLSIPGSGVLCTSSPAQLTMHSEAYYYVGSGRRVLLEHSSHPATNLKKMILGGDFYGGSSGRVTPDELDRRRKEPDYESERDRLLIFVGTRSEYARRVSEERVHSEEGR